jgi:hypothetical protein
LPTPAPPRPPSHPIDVSTLQHLREIGILSQVEYDLAVREIGASTGATHAAEANSLVLGRWVTTLYGFLEGDVIYDSTQSFTDAAGNAQVLRPPGAMAPFASPLPSLAPGTAQPLEPSQGYLGSHGQMLFGVRNTRLGLRMQAPGSETVHASALLEMDFLGNQPSGVSQAAAFTSPTMRLRHAMFRLETPIVDVMVGQYWHLFGWQEGYLPNTTEIQGVPGELYARAPQVRVSKTFAWDAVRLDAALAAVRPPSLSEVPETEAGVRVSLPKWAGMHTAGATATALIPASIAITGDVRYFEVPEAASILPTAMVRTTAGSVAGDLFVPILAAREDRRDGALSLLGQAVYGHGIADMYSGMSSGVLFPFVPTPPAQAAAPAWPTNIDQGLVTYDITPGVFALHPVEWTSLLVGLEYYLPGFDGALWVSGNYSHIESNKVLDGDATSSQFARSGDANPGQYFYPASTAQVRRSEDWWDANVFFDPVASVRVGVELAAFYDHYVDGFTATNYRAQASGFFLF